MDRNELTNELSTKLLNVNGKRTQLYVIIGELAELITAITDYSSKRGILPKSKNIDLVLDEIIDVELQLILLKKILCTDDINVLHKLDILGKIKYEGLLKKLNSL